VCVWVYVCGCVCVVCVCVWVVLCLCVWVCVLQFWFIVLITFMVVADVILGASDSTDVQPLSKTCKFQYFELLTSNRHYSCVSICQGTKNKAWRTLFSLHFHIFLKFVQQNWTKFWQSVFSYVMTFGIYEGRTVYMSKTQSIIFWAKSLGKLAVNQ